MSNRLLAALGCVYVRPPVVAPVTAVYSNDWRTTIAPAGWTYTRSGTAWYFDNTLTPQSVAANTPPGPEYYWGDGTTNRGIGIMAARTNQLLNSTAPATQSRTLSADGTYCLRIIGSGQIDVSSAGSVTFPDGTTCVEDTPIRIILTASSQSVTFTKTGTVSFFQCEFINAGAQTNFAATDPIVTAGAVVTRNAASLKRSLASLGMNANAFTVVIEYHGGMRLRTDGILCALAVGDSNTCLRASWRSDASIQLRSETAGVLDTGCTVNGGATAEAGELHKFAFSGDETGIALSVDGTVASTAAVASPHLGSFDTLFVGALLNGASVINSSNCQFATITCYNGRVSDQFLQVLTAPENPALTGLVNLVYWMGQSGATGAKALPALTTTPPYPDQVFMFNDGYTIRGPARNIPYTQDNTSSITSIVPAFEGQSTIPPWRRTDLGETGIVACMAQFVAGGSTDILVGRGSGAIGNPIEDLGSDSESFANVVDTADAITALAIASGGSTKVYKITWVQGEANRGTPYQDYFDALDELIEDINTEVKAATGQAEDIIFQIAQLGSLSASGEGDPVQLAQFDMALGPSANSKCRLIGPRWHIPFQDGDGKHHSAIGNIQLGEHDGHAAFVEQDTASPWVPMHMTLADEIDVSTIDVTFYVPFGDLTQDAATVIQGAAYKAGFEYTDDDMDPAAPYTRIASVTVTSATKCRITFTHPRTGANPYILIAYNGPGLANSELLPDVATGGSGGANGPVVITVSYGAEAEAQATYNATIAGGALVSIESVETYGLYPPDYVGTFDGVSVSGGGLTGATIDNFRIVQSFKNGDMAAAWSDLRDEDPAVGDLSGEPLYNRPCVQKIAVT